MKRTIELHIAFYAVAGFIMLWFGSSIHYIGYLLAALCFFAASKYSKIWERL